MLLLALKACSGVGLLTVAWLAVGSWPASLLPSNFARWERVALALPAGFGLLSLCLFLMGQFSFTLRSILLLVCVLTIVSLSRLYRLLLIPSGRPSTAGWRLAWRKIPKIPLVLIALILIITAVSGLAEITGDWGSDTVAYHLLGPRVWLRDGAIRPVPDNCHTAFPATVETMYGALWAIGGERAPVFSSFLTFGMLLLIAASLGMRSGLDARAAWWLAALVTTMPAIYYGAVDGFVDGLYATFVLASLRVGLDALRPRDWAVFGVFGGLAIGTKYTGLLAFPALWLCLLWLAMRRQQRGSELSMAQHDSPAARSMSLSAAVSMSMLAIFVACVVAGPYYLRNWILLGCPIYPPPPGLVHFCNAKYLPPDVVTAFHAYIRQRGEGLGRGLAAFLALPFNLTYHTSNFHGAGGIGVVPLGLGPLGLFAWRKNRVVQTLGVLAWLLLILWFVTQQESRFLIHVYVLMGIFGVLGWRHIAAHGSVAARRLACTLVGISLAYGLVMLAKNWPRDIHAVLSPGFAEKQRREDIPFYESFQYLNHTPDVKKVLILDRSVPPFYCEKNYVKPVGQWGERTLPGAVGPLEAVQQAGALGITHILDVNSAIAPFQIVGNRAALTLVRESPNQRVYRVN